MRCTKCGKDVLTGGKICTRCMKNWTYMRGIAFTTLVNVHGQITQSNHPVFKKEMKRLERVWRKDPIEFEKEIELIS